MKTYTAYFRTDADYAEHEFEAETPEQALVLARAFYDDQTECLMFEGYDGGQAVNEIEIVNSENDALTVWRDDDLHLRLAASDLLEACELAAQRLELNDHQGEEREFIAVLQAAIAKAKGGAS